LKEGGNKTPLLQLFAGKAASMKERETSLLAAIRQDLQYEPLEFPSLWQQRLTSKSLNSSQKKKKECMKHHRPKLISSKEQSPTISQILTVR
jgi:hypothetical protein